MVPLCAHIHPNRQTCGSPALRDQGHCYFHQPGRRPVGPRRRTTRPGYRWYGLNRRVPTLAKPDIMPAFTEDQVIDTGQWKLELEHRRDLKTQDMLLEFSENLDRQSGSLQPKPR